ncbi:uncharacterized protein LOC143694703 [Agelaius phoeniceus]|uniref:uncharacterized protein LOC143694703 n=1 Tax=Agelaius phoeniceus TaxID=39638 RepID=UPI0040551CD8
MWATIMSSSRTAEPALQLLLDVLSAWPVISVSTSDGDDAGVFALAATVALWRVFNLAWRSPVVLEYFPSLFLSLLFQAEMRHVSIIWCCDMASRLFDLLSQGISDWELPALAFLVEVLDCLDLSQCGEKVLEILTRHLQSESRQMRRMALRGLVGLTSMDPSMYSLTESLGKLLWDRDEDIVEMSLVVLSFLPLQKDLAIASPMALQLAEALWHLFDNDKSLVRLLSIGLFQDVITLVVAKGEKALKKHVSQSLLPLFFQCHDENGHVAQASRETLLSAVRFLKRKDLKQLLKTDQMWRFAECLVRTGCNAQPDAWRSRLPRRLWLLAGPQGSVAVQSVPSSRLQKMRDQLCRLWQSRPFLCGRG